MLRLGRSGLLKRHVVVDLVGAGTPLDHNGDMASPPQTAFEAAAHAHGRPSLTGGAVVNAAAREPRGSRILPTSSGQAGSSSTAGSPTP